MGLFAARYDMRTRTMTGDAAPNIVVTSSRARLPAAAAARHNAGLSVRERPNRFHWLFEFGGA